jgi:catechol 2,3-dioxygenase-like lactoylglutathione lyase family enzyme
MGSHRVLSANHTGLVVEDLDRFIGMMTGLFDYEVVDRGPRDIEKQSRVTGYKDAKVEIAYLKGGGALLEIICYRETDGTKAYRPRPVDIGHWHLSINIEEIDKVRDDAKGYGMAEVGEKITVTNGPNKGNQIIYLASPEGVVFELTQLASRSI